MEKGIGTIVFKLREQAGYTQEQLCHGICSISELARIEADQLVPGHFQLDRLFGRMGKSTERLEYVLPREIYDLYELQYRIQTKICHQSLKEAEDLLDEYEMNKHAEKPLHRQFIEQERAQIAWMQEKDTEQVLKKIHAAISRTMDGDEVLNDKVALSAEEMKLLLFRWEVSKGSRYERSVDEIRGVLTHLERKKMDIEEKVKVFPYAVLLLSKECDMEKDYDFLVDNLNIAFELLREEGKILYLTEVMEEYIRVLEYKKGEEETVKQLKSERESLLLVEEKFQMNFEKYHLFQHLNRSFELDFELIRNTRIASGMAQETLCDGICAQETLSRIETGIRSPSNRNMNQLLKRMGRERNRVDTIIMAETFEAITIKKKIAKCLQRFENDKVDLLLKQLEMIIDGNILENKQYILSEKVREACRVGKMEWNDSIEELNNILQMTLKTGDERTDRYKLTVTESAILNQIANLYYNNGEKQKAIQIYRFLLQNYDESLSSVAFHIREWELFMGNLATALEETGQPQNAMAICKKRMLIALEIGKINDLGRALITMASALEQRQDKECILYFRQGMDLLRLTKMEKRYQAVKKYVNESGFAFKGKI